MSDYEAICKVLSLVRDLERTASNSYDRAEYRKAIEHLKNAYDPSITCDGDGKVFRLEQTYRGYSVVKVGAYYGRDMYLAGVRKGVCKWCQDHTYSAHYTLETASKHIANLRKGEIA